MMIHKHLERVNNKEVSTLPQNIKANFDENTKIKLSSRSLKTNQPNIRRELKSKLERDSIESA